MAYLNWYMWEDYAILYDDPVKDKYLSGFVLFLLGQSPIWHESLQIVIHYRYGRLLGG
jgi:hypothetical protein